MVKFSSLQLPGVFTQLSSPSVSAKAACCRSDTVENKHPLNSSQSSDYADLSGDARLLSYPIFVYISVQNLPRAGRSLAAVFGSKTVFGGK